jgi:hypothetical protein
MTKILVILLVGYRVARWFIFKPKILIWVNFGGPYIEKYWYIGMAIWNILRTFGIFYDPLGKFVFIWYIFSSFGNMYREKYDNPDRLSMRKNEQTVRWKLFLEYFCRALFRWRLLPVIHESTTQFFLTLWK